jgi:hypothetical protein
MEKVHKPITTQYYTPSSKPFRICLEYLRKITEELDLDSRCLGRLDRRRDKISGLFKKFPEWATETRYFQTRFIKHYPCRFSNIFH